MASVNKVIIVGNLGNDPEVRQFDNGNKIATVSIATNERWTDKQTGDVREHTEWHRVIFNNRLAEIVGQYMRKGSSIYVEGSLRTRKWTDNSGIERYTTEIRADSMQMLGGRNDGGNNQQQNYQQPQQSYQQQQPQQQWTTPTTPPPPAQPNWQAQQGQQQWTTPTTPPPPAQPMQPMNNDDMPF